MIVWTRWGRCSCSALALTLAVCASWVFTGTASAGVVTQLEHATVRVRGLTRAERSAIEITSVTAATDPSLGLIVTVDFDGDIEQDLGQGDLKSGLLALVLEPSSAAQAATGLVDTGGGFAPVAFPIVGHHGRRVTVKRGTLDLFSPEQVLRTFAGGQFGVIRDDDQVVFRVTGPALDDLAAIKVKMFARSPAPIAKTARTLTASAWRAVLDERPAAVASLSIDPSVLSAQELTEVGTDLTGVLTLGAQPQLRREQRVRSQLKAAIGDYATIEPSIRASRRLRSVNRGQLVADVGNAGVRIGRLKNEVSALATLSGKVGALGRAMTSSTVQVVQTDAGLSQYLSPQPARGMSSLRPSGVPVIDLDAAIRYQQFTGVGAAMTDSSAWLIYDELSPADRQALLEALFGAPGSPNALGIPAIHLNFLRVGIGASGAMTVGAPYSYDDLSAGETDPSLSHFSIAHDLSYIIPTLQQVLAINPEIEISANPWSPPAWMKANDSLDNVGDLGTLLPADYGPLANYFVKFIEAYQSNGIPIDAIAPENEPSTATDYPGLTFPEPDEAQFITQNLKPALKAAGLDPKIYGNDLSWNSTAYADSLASGPATGDLTGISWHCYFGSPTAMSELHQADPGLDQIVDECSPEIRAFGTPEFLISSLRNWASAVSVWSVALDPGGQPVQPGNDCGGCLGPVTINEQTQTVTPRTEYYQLGQVSAYVQPGAVRIDSPNFVTYGTNSSDIETVSAGLDDVAFLNPDGSEVLVAYDNSAAPITFAVDSDGSYFTYTIPAQAMATFVWH